MFKIFVLILIFTIRLSVISLLFLINPITAIIINIIADYADGPLYKYYLKIPPLRAQYYDKILDYIYYVGLLTLVISQKTVVLPFLLLLFIFRTVGEFIFFITGNKRIFVYFPNFFEYFTLGFFITQAIDPTAITSSLNWIALLLLVITWFRVWNESFLHKENKTTFQVFWLPLLRSLGFKWADKIKKELIAKAIPPFIFHV